jgi:hypothetical protein
VGPGAQASDSKATTSILMAYSFWISHICPLVVERGPHFGHWVLTGPTMAKLVSLAEVVSKRVVDL